MAATAIRSSLPQDGNRALAGIQRITATAAVAEADVEVAVRSKGDQTAVVVCIGLVAQQHAGFAGRVGAVGVAGDLEVGDDRVVAVVRLASRRRDQVWITVIIGEIEVTGAGVVWREGEAETLALPQDGDDQDIEEGRRQRGAILENADRPSLLYNKQAALESSPAWVTKTGWAKPLATGVSVTPPAV